MDHAEVIIEDSKYCRKCASCRSWIRCDTLQALQHMFVGLDGKPLKRTRRKNQTTNPKRTEFDLYESYENHEDFFEAVSLCMELHDNHRCEAAVQPLRMVTLTSTFLIENDISMATCAQSEGQKIQFTRSRSIERKTERDVQSIRRYTVAREFFECHDELHISFSMANESATIIYEHNGHTEAPTFHMTAEVKNYIKFEKTELHTITRQQVYNVWVSITRREWERDAANDFRSSQLLIGEQDGYRLIEGLQEPGVSLAFTTPCFTDSAKYNREKMTEVFIDSTFGTNKHGYELYCVLTEYDLVSLPLSYLLLDTRGIQEVGNRGARLTEWFVALRSAGLKPNVVHTDKDFAEVTAASIAFKRGNPSYIHHLCLPAYYAVKVKATGFDSIDNAKSSIQMTSLPHYLHFMSHESDWILSKVQTRICTKEQARTLRAMIKRHLLRHHFLPKIVCAMLMPHRHLLQEMLEYCKSMEQPKLFRYFWSNWYRPEFRNFGSRWEIASLHWRILKKDYASRFIKPRLDETHSFYGSGAFSHPLTLQVQAGREKPSVCPSFILNSRYLCKHLVCFYSSPHPDGNGTYIELCPLIRFNDSDLVGTVTLSSGVEASDFVNDDTRSNYADELASFQLIPCEDPEAKEENDEEAMELLRILHWASGEQCQSNPRMQRDISRFISNPAAFIAHFKRPYEEALGTTRSEPSHTMRKAPKSYFYMRPQNQSPKSGE
ncbi:hypothetical protein V1527DRAFT_495035 [Lipomyces starkeyi]